MTTLRRALLILAFPVIFSLIWAGFVLSVVDAHAVDGFAQSACVPDATWTNHFENTHATALKGYGLSWYASVDNKALRKSFDCWTDDLYPYADMDNVVNSTTITIYRHYLGGWTQCATHTDTQRPPNGFAGVPVESQWSMSEQVGQGPCPEANFPDGYTEAHVYSFTSSSYTWYPRHETFLTLYV